MQTKLEQQEKILSQPLKKHVQLDLDLLYDVSQHNDSYDASSNRKYWSWSRRRIKIGCWSYNILGGMIISTFFTLYITPSMYLALAKNTKRIDVSRFRIKKRIDLKNNIFIFVK